MKMVTKYRRTLNDLAPGEVGTVRALHCAGPERRRLMDLGIVPGTVITVEMRSPLGDPTAYLIRGALIALRHEQAQLIEMDSSDEEITERDEA